MAVLDFVDCEKHGNKVGKIVCHGCYQQLQAENEELRKALEEIMEYDDLWNSYGMRIIAKKALEGEKP